MRNHSTLAPVTVVFVGVGLCLFTAPRLGSAAWPEFGRAISTAPKAQVHAAIASDGLGGAVITWQDARNDTTNLFVQHVLESGELDATWPASGRALLTDRRALVDANGGQILPLIVPDGTGGAIVVWQDIRDNLTDFNIFAQHVLASGAVDAAWPANGRALCFIEGQQKTHVLVSDGAGGAIVAWMDSRPGASVFDIYAQHILNSGVDDPAWPVNGLAVCNAAGVQEFPAIVEDGTGGAIVSWDDARSGTTGFDVYAQHVLGSGKVDPAWPVNGRVLCAAGGDQGRPTMTLDGTHGAVVAWTDSRIVGTAHIFAQHVFGSGAVDPAWPVDGRALAGVNVLESRPLAVTDGGGGAIVTWQGFTTQLNMYAQHVTGTGFVDPAWPVGGRALSNRKQQQTHATIVTDGSCGAVVAWQDSFDVVAHHVLSSGALDPTYPDTGLAVCYLPSQQGGPAMVATGGGGAIVAWTDTRDVSTTSPDIYAFQVLAARTADVPPPSGPEFTFAPPSPNPARASLTLRFALTREARVRLAIYDVTGRRVRDLASGMRATGEHAIAWDLRDDGGHTVSAGLYFARLEAEGRTVTQKFTALR